MDSSYIKNKRGRPSKISSSGSFSCPSGLANNFKSNITKKIKPSYIKKKFYFINVNDFVFINGYIIIDLNN